MQTAISILDCLHFDAPTTEQKNALLAMADFVKETNTDDFLILCGAAGTGKSSIMSAVVGYLNNHDFAYQIAAPTGRAARLLGRKTNTLASTIHSLIYTVKTDRETGKVYFIPRDADNDTRTIFIIDEASMINAKPSIVDDSQFIAPDALLTDLAKFIKACNPQNKIIFLGDRYQLAPYGEKESCALQPEYLSSTYGWKGNSHFLTEVKRQEDGSLILKNARQIREVIENGGTAAINAPKVGNNTWQTAQHFAANLKDYGAESTIAIARSHRQNRIFCDAVREKMFGSNKELLKVSDVMLVTQNWRRNNQILHNGDQVVVEEVNLKEVEKVGGLHFCTAKLRYRNIDGTEGVIQDYIVLECLLPDDGKLNNLLENQLRHERIKKNLQYRESGNAEDDKYVGAIRLMYGYSITCNKAQGGEWDKVYINTFGHLELRWAYTAVTRAKQELFQC